MKTEHTAAQRPGATLKQHAVNQFLSALDAYKLALRTGRDVIVASVRVHSTSGMVPPRYRRLVRLATKSKGQS